jgi:hypothetical protein
VHGECADGGGGGAVAAGVGRLAPEERFELWGEMRPGTHVLRLLLHPDHAALGVTRRDRLETLGVQRVELLDADDRGVGDALLLAVVDQVVVHLARAQQHTLRFARRGWILEDFLEGAGGELIESRDRSRVAQERLRRHHDQRLAEVALHLAPQQVEEVRRRRDVRDLEVVLGAELEEAFESG